MPTTVQILVYRGEPVDSINYRHAALFFKFPNGSQSLMNAEGTPGLFEFKAREDYAPEFSIKLAATIPVAEFSDAVNPWSIRPVVSATPIKNGDLGWNCQNWVADALGRLVDFGYLTTAQREPAYRQMIRVIMEAPDNS
ncbi:hypothetical protein N7456_009076 [Penicillium angulare]|uniref:Uncharacterized protein n=1 Tax=Penicillium angulare TaxID=116970 RepID=A0A9W9F3Z6_9EURO|nr:hypothetical protein N7456_009076 [Penicillium angulare]